MQVMQKMLKFFSCLSFLNDEILVCLLSLGQIVRITPVHSKLYQYNNTYTSIQTGYQLLKFWEYKMHIVRYARLR